VCNGPRATTERRRVLESSRHDSAELPTFCIALSPVRPPLALSSLSCFCWALYSLHCDL
jgi:hypothetical protein